MFVGALQVAKMNRFSSNLVHKSNSKKVWMSLLNSKIKLTISRWQTFLLEKMHNIIT